MPKNIEKVKLKIGTKEFAKAGADAKWKTRHDIILELSAYVDKAYQNYLLKWKTEHLQKLLNAYKK